MFRYNFRRALDAVLKVYREARVSISSRGLTLLTYPPHVRRLKCLTTALHWLASAENHPVFRMER